MSAMALPPPIHTTAAVLPLPDPADQVRSDALAEQVAQTIATAGGWLAFDHWMAMVLYTPGLGYYSGQRSPLGAQGDFVTAPELSPLFGRVVAQQVAECLRAMAPEGPWQVLEFGAGSGALAASLWPALVEAGTPPETYSVIEVSGLLRAQQAATLKQRAPEALASVRWLDALPDRFSGVVIANEVLDAMPVRLFERSGNGWGELGVVIAPGGGLVLAPMPSSMARPAPCSLPDPDRFPPGYRLEIAEQARAWMASLGSVLQRGAVLLFDYGFPAQELFHPQRTGGTLMAHYRHRALTDLLARPGLQDITAHVDFSAVAQAGVQAGLNLAGYTSQARFLLNCGLLEQAQSLLAEGGAANPARLRAMGAVQTLLSEAEMGELFKVIGFSRGLEANAVPWSGFSQGDRQMMLAASEVQEDGATRRQTGRREGRP
jgi:SAM-dependent MidA family methyltransferase